MPDTTGTRPAIPGTQLDLDPIITRANAASPSPWTATDHYPHVVIQGADDAMVSTNLSRDPSADAEFIAAARTDVPVLLAELDRARDTLRLVESLLYSTDGDRLADGAEIPAGELARMLYDPDPQPS